MVFEPVRKTSNSSSVDAHVKNQEISSQIKQQQYKQTINNMCFSMEMSAAFAAIGLFTTYLAYSRTRNTALTCGVFFFFSMELLQAIQYFFIADTIESAECDTHTNKVLTILGFLHICLQPYFCHFINASLTKDTEHLAQYKVIKRLCLIGGFLLFCRFLLSGVWPSMDTQAIPSTEWMRGHKICTFRGNYHLAWSVPMADPTYFIPGTAIHSFLMFAPYVALYEKKYQVVQGIFLFVFGPYTASLITSNLMEQGSIWCFFSVAQIAILLLFARNDHTLNWEIEKDQSVASTETTTVSDKKLKSQ
jgi:hypothetical protein